MELVYTYSWGLFMFYGVYAGLTLDWLTSEIEADTTRYPVDDGDDAASEFDQTWATNAKEVTAWKDAGKFMA